MTLSNDTEEVASGAPQQHVQTKCISSPDYERIEGLMAIHMKKSNHKRKNNLFRGSKSCYYVVNDIRQPFLEFYTNDSCQQAVFILSLVNATLSFESDDANVVMVCKLFSVLPLTRFFIIRKSVSVSMYNDGKSEIPSTSSHKVFFFLLKINRKCYFGSNASI